MDIMKCQAFIEAVEQGSILGASQKLDYTPSGINRMINALEDELGITLLIRNRKGVFLTTDGEILLPLIRQLVNHNERIFQTCAELNSLICGTLKIGSYYSVASHKLPELLGKFTTLYPGIRIELTEDGEEELLTMLKENRIDCCFIGDPPKDEIHFLPLMEDEAVVWLPRHHLFASQPAFPVEALNDEVFIAMNREKSGIVNRLISKYQIHLNIRYTTHDAYTAYRMVEAGLGISVNNLLTNKQWSGNVVILPLIPHIPVSIGLALSGTAQTSPAASRFIHFIKENWSNEL